MTQGLGERDQTRGNVRQENGERTQGERINGLLII